MAKNFKFKIGGRPTFDKWVAGLNRRRQKYQESEQYRTDQALGKEKDLTDDWEDTLFTIPPESIALAAKELKIKNIDTEEEVDSILNFLKDKGVMVTEKEEKKKKKKNKIFDMPDIPEGEKAKAPKEYKGGPSKKYTKKIKGILDSLEGKKPNLAKELNKLLNKVKKGKYEKVPTRFKKKFKGILKEFDYSPGLKDQKKKKKKSDSTSADLLDTISDLLEEKVSSDADAAKVAEAQRKANKINRRISDMQASIEIRGVERDTAALAGTGAFKHRKNQFKIGAE